jgi:hypothetical protein
VQLRYETLTCSPTEAEPLRVPVGDYGARQYACGGTLAARGRHWRDAVVATAFASADADYDNGTAFHCTPGRGRSYDRAVQRVGAGGHVPR